MIHTLSQSFGRAFMGQSPGWYKLTIVGFLLGNPILLLLFGPVVTGWVVLAEFILTLGMALRCYPLQPGGLLALEAVLIGLTTPESVYEEVTQAFPVILLLIFMVAGIYFLRDLLLYVFTRLILRVKSRELLALTFCGAAAVLSAFLDALTVVAVAVTVGMGFYEVYHRVASGKTHQAPLHDAATDEHVQVLHRENLEGFRGFLRSLMMHGAVGTAIGGVMTQVGEPQNLLIAEHAEWNFGEFFLVMAPVTLPVMLAGFATCWTVEHFRLFGYGTPLPDATRAVLEDFAKERAANATTRDRQAVITQGLIAIVLVLALAFHVAEVGLIGLMVIILATTFTGVTEEHRIGKAFEAALPFTALLVVFFVIVAAIHDQHLFEPMIAHVLSLEGQAQAAMLYLASGALSTISDNVFVASIYITEVKAAFLQGAVSRDQFEWLAVAINTGTNIPSVATPNGQAAFLFLLTSTLAPLIRLGYARMVWMAVPYFVVMTTVGLLALYSATGGL
ncbi:MAG TPA: sodium/proton antiporter NhaB [Steroidobacteraceae bacterium]|jgi:NhaB family Na+:H+ antiporter|nr:sodium/proton antiporter NhaB [Steroidobacteraceae bacterium]